MRLQRKLKSREGFSLAEMLLTVLIMMLVSVLLANGIPTVKAIYERVTVGANARVMLTTTIAALRNELGTAKNVKLVDSTTVKYHSTDTQATSQIYKSDNVIMLQEYANKITELINIGENTSGESVKEGVPRRLVTDASASGREYVTDGLYATYDTVSLSADRSVITFNGLKVMRQKGEKKKNMETPVKPINLSIRLIFVDRSRS